MVFFTCNACGQSIKKNRVEKHWQSECPRCEVLSCMDCGKDFYGDEYIEHTSCITEAEKYQGSLFKGEKGGQSKGEKKQQEWLKQVMLSARNGSHNSKISQLVTRILEYPNIPRKRAKFENFVKNSINVRDKGTLNSLWEVFNQSSVDNGTEEKVDQKKVDQKEEVVSEEIQLHKVKKSSEDAVADDNVTGKELKRKRKRSSVEEVEDDTQKENGIIEDELICKKKKKKKKKNKEET